MSKCLNVLPDAEGLTDRQRERETDRQTDRQTDRERERETDRETERHRKTQKDTEVERERNDKYGLAIQSTHMGLSGRVIREARVAAGLKSDGLRML